MRASRRVSKGVRGPPRRPARARDPDKGKGTKRDIRGYPKDGRRLLEAGLKANYLHGTTPDNRKVRFAYNSKRMHPRRLRFRPRVRGLLRVPPVRAAVPKVQELLRRLPGRPYGGGVRRASGSSPGEAM